MSQKKKAYKESGFSWLRIQTAEAIREFQFT
jgi:hypothetical protein